MGLFEERLKKEIKSLKEGCFQMHIMGAELSMFRKKTKFQQLAL